MPDVVLRNRSLPGQPIVVPIPNDGTELPADTVAHYEAMGWRVAATDPAKIPPAPTVDPADQGAPAPENQES